MDRNKNVFQMHCTNLLSIALVKHHDQKQVVDERGYFHLWL